MGKSQDERREENEYNTHARRFDREHSSIRIYEDKRIDEIQNKLWIIEGKINKLISMLTAHDYACDRRNKK